MHFFSAPCVVWRHQLDMARCTTSRSWVHEHLWFCNCKHPSTKSLQVARHCPVMRRPRRPPTWALTLDQVWSKVSATSWLGSIVHSAARDSSNKPHATTPKDHRSAALEISTWQKRARLNNGWLIENKRAQTLSKIPGFHFHPTRPFGAVHASIQHIGTARSTARPHKWPHGRGSKLLQVRSRPKPRDLLRSIKCWNIWGLRGVCLCHVAKTSHARVAQVFARQPAPLTYLKMMGHAPSWSTHPNCK